MALSDAVAAQVLGEVHALAKRIDELCVLMENTAAKTDAAALAIIKNTRQVLIEAEEAAKLLHKGNTLPLIDRLHEKLRDQINALNHTAAAVTQAGETVKRDARQSIIDAREAARLTVEQSKASVAITMQQQAAAAMESVAKKNKTGTLIIGGCIASAIVLAAAIAGHMVGKDAGAALGSKARDEIAAAAWANTADGKTAHSLVQSGMLNSLTRCTNQGWRAEGNVFCTPYPDTNLEKPAFFGWRVK